MARSAAQSGSAARDFVSRVASALDSFRIGRRMLLAAVSGGPDSTALVRALHALRSKTTIGLGAVHVNHALRGADSEADEAFVRSLCANLRIPLVCRRAEVALSAAERSESIESTARRLRQQAFAEAAQELDAPFLATAHTADDQAETVLHRLMRGTGLAGIAGIPRTRALVPGVTLVRPLLEIPRRDVLVYLKAIGQDAREDHSNRDLAFTRNRIRQELIPYLERHFNPQVTEALTRLASLAADAQDVLERQVARLRRRVVTRIDSTVAVLHVTGLHRTPKYLICELIRQLWTDQEWPLRDIGYLELQRVADLMARPGQQGACDLPGGIRAEWSRGRFLLRRREGPSSH